MIITKRVCKIKIIIYIYIIYICYISIMNYNEIMMMMIIKKYETIIIYEKNNINT